jgi:phytoene dehydrogenase-like protein
MGQACESVGVEISTDSPVDRVVVANGSATGVTLTSGEVIAAKRVIANVNPKMLYGQMFNEGDLDAEFARRMDGYKNGSGTFRMNVALSKLPDFTALPGKDNAEHHQCGIVIAPTLDYMDRAYVDAKANGWSKQPTVEIPPNLIQANNNPHQSRWCYYHSLTGEHIRHCSYRLTDSRQS